MVQELTGIYNFYDLDFDDTFDLDGDGNNIDTAYLKDDPASFNQLKGEIVTAVIDGVGSGDGSIPGLDDLTGSVPLDQDLNFSINL